jgi:phage gp36-like protein
VAYATIDDIFGRFKPIRTMIGAGSFEVSSNEVTSIFILDADSFVDAYLAKRYVTPITPVPSMVTQISSDLAIFNMMTEKQVQVPDSFQARYDRSLKSLEMLRDGEMVLPDAVEIAAAGDNEAWSANQDFHSIFHPVLDELDQAADADWIEDAKDVRINDA